MRTMTAAQGDTFDILAFRLWGRERLAWRLLDANPEHREVVFFSGGEQLRVPEVSLAAPAADFMPPWKRGGAA